MAYILIKIPVSRTHRLNMHVLNRKTIIDNK